VTPADRLTIGAALAVASAWLAAFGSADDITGAHADADAVLVSFGAHPRIVPVGGGQFIVSRQDGSVRLLASHEGATLPPMRRVDLTDPDDRRAYWADAHFTPVEPPESPQP
jgi:hypothetical protein